MKMSKYMIKYIVKAGTQSQSLIKVVSIGGLVSFVCEEWATTKRYARMVNLGESPP